MDNKEVECYPGMVGRGYVPAELNYAINPSLAGSRDTSGKAAVTRTWAAILSIIPSRPWVSLISRNRMGVFVIYRPKDCFRLSAPQSRQTSGPT